MRWLFVFLLLLVGGVSVTAQGESDITYGSTLTGRLSEGNPRAVYFFEGQRGEVVSITMRVIDGDLDPVLTVLDNQGRLVATLDDSDADKTPSLHSLTLPRTDRYYVVIGRFGYALGTTSGGYELVIQRLSVSSESGSHLRYGDSIINRISDMEPQLYYTFQANQGDIISIRMRRVSGDLDPYLQVVQVHQGNAFVVADNDDVIGGATPFDAAIEGLVIEETDTYVVIASRYGQASGTSSGNFLLAIEEARDSGLGNSARAPYPLQFGDTVEGTLTNTQFTRYYRFEAQTNDIVSVRMERVGGGLDPFLVLADANFQELVSDDDSGGGQNAFIAQYLIPQSGTYHILTTRFEREAGTSSGNYRLQLQSLGNAFDDVPEGFQRIAYGSTLTGYIDSQNPQSVYVFWGEAGDVVSISMNRGDGNLDPVVTLLDTDQQPITSNDDGGGGQNARIAAYRIPATGAYFIRAERYSGGPPGDPNTSGSFILVLARRFN